MTDVTTISAPLASSRNSSTRRLAIILSLILVLAAAGASLYLVRTVDGQLSDITGTYEVRRQARDLLLAVVDAETGQRGYVITRDRIYLEPYEAAVQQMGSIYKKLLEQVADNPDQRARVEALGPQIEQKRAELAATVALIADGDVAGAMRRVEDDTGRVLMNGIRDTVSDFIASEDARLIDRNGEMEANRQWLVAAIIAALGASAILAYAIFARSQQQVAALAAQQNALLVQKETLEAHVMARTVEVEEARAHAERERARVETLLQDTNHRIGNSLATVSSLHGLQVTRSKSAEVKAALEAAQARVQAIASGHRRLRLGADLETTNAAEFLEAVVDDIASTLPTGRTITLHKDIAPLVVPARDATTIGIVLGELVTNAVKHAFPSGRDGNIWVRFAPDAGGEPALVVEDDGSGVSGEPPSEGGGLGSLSIRQLVGQFGGEPQYARREGGGTAVTLKLPKLAPEGGATA
jgi:two-component sensor histidine kinase/CHASE3 domain sensor protein